MENLEKIKEIIGRYRGIGVLPSPDFRKDSFPAALALFYSLKKIGKNVNLIAENPPQTYDFLLPRLTENSLKESPPASDFQINIREAAAKISGLFYEKTRGGLKLFLKTEGGELKKEDISIGEAASPALSSMTEADAGELFITVGIKGLAVVGNLTPATPEFIVNIDNQPENENFGDLNLVRQTSPTLSEIVLDVICVLDDRMLSREIANLLLAGIVEGTSNFQDGQTTADTFQAVSCLIENGANLKKITSRLSGLPDQKSIRLFGQVLTKINTCWEQNLAWVLLEKQDFAKTESSPSDLIFTLNKLKRGLFPLQNFFCLWEQNLSPIVVRGVFYSPNKKIIKELSLYFNGSQKGDGFLFQAEENNIEEVKNQILQILKT